MNFQELNNLINSLENENNEANNELITFYKKKRSEALTNAFTKGLATN